MRRTKSQSGWGPGLAEMAGLAMSVRDQAAGEDDEGLMAIAWVMLNRLAAARPHDTGSLLHAPDPQLARALSALCRAWAGDIPDPTRGATRFHPHTEMPRWARQETPRALIGRNFFYAP